MKILCLSGVLVVITMVAIGLAQRGDPNRTAHIPPPKAGKADSAASSQVPGWMIGPRLDQSTASPAHSPIPTGNNLMGEAVVQEIMEIRNSLNRQSIASLLDCPLPGQSGTSPDHTAAFRQSIEQLAGIDQTASPVPAKSREPAVKSEPARDKNRVPVLLPLPTKYRSTPASGVAQIADLIGQLNDASSELANDNRYPASAELIVRYRRLSAELQKRIDKTGPPSGPGESGDRP